MAGNKIAPAKIVAAAVPASSSGRRLVEPEKHPKQAWEFFCTSYSHELFGRASRDPVRAATIRLQLMQFQCNKPDMDVAQWADDFRRLYDSLCDVDALCVSDQSFVYMILVNMPHEESWHDLRFTWHANIERRGSRNPVSSTELLNAIRDEYWLRNRKNPRSIFWHADGADSAEKTRKRSRTPDAASTSSFAKRPRTLSNNVPPTSEIVAASKPAIHYNYDFTY